MGHLCFMMIFDEFVCFTVLTALSSELPQDCQNRPNDQNGDPKQLCLLKNAFYSIILAIQGDDIAGKQLFHLFRSQKSWKKVHFSSNMVAIDRHLGQFWPFGEPEATLKKVLPGL